MKIEKLKPGKVVYDCHKYTMGNTPVRTMGVWCVHVISIDLERQTVTASWNGNAAQVYPKRQWSKWREKVPPMVTGIMGSKRIATREERAALKAEPKP